MNILVVAASPFELYGLTAILLLLKEKKPDIHADVLCSTKLLEFIHPSQEVLNVYDVVHKFELIGLTPSSRKLPRNITRGVRLRRAIRKLPLKTYDYCFINSYNEFFSNVLYRQLPKTTRLVIVTTYKSNEEHYETRSKPLLNTTLRFCDFLFGYAPTIHKWSKETGRSADRKISKYPPYTKILIADHTPSPNRSGVSPPKVSTGDFMAPSADRPLSRERDIISSPPKKGERKREGVEEQNQTFILPPPFMALKKIFPPMESEKTAIFVAGERTPPYPSWNEKDEQNFAAFFDYLRTEFPDHDLYFKPRPKLTEMVKIEKYLNRFKLVDQNEPLEELFAKKKFEKIITIKSTVSRLGVYYNIPSYVIYPLFNIPEDERKATADVLFKDLENIIFVKELSDLKTLPPAMLAYESLAEQYANVILHL